MSLVRGSFWNKKKEFFKSNMLSLIIRNFYVRIVEEEFHESLTWGHIRYKLMNLGKSTKVMNIVWSRNSAKSIRNLQHVHNTNNFPLFGRVEGREGGVVEFLRFLLFPMWSNQVLTPFTLSSQWVFNMFPSSH